jgi:hypothetical protein
LGRDDPCRFGRRRVLFGFHLRTFHYYTIMTKSDMTELTLPPKYIKAVTIVVRNVNLTRPLDEHVDIERLQGTYHDVNEADRVVYIDSLGNERYLKDRYPQERLPGVEIEEYRMNRPVNMTLADIKAWIMLIRTIRINIMMGDL